MRFGNIKAGWIGWKRSKIFFLAYSSHTSPICQMRKLPPSRSCFVCGECNPIGLKLELETNGRMIRAVFVPRAEHIGFKQTVHGGILSTLLDEMMAWACAVQAKRFAFCAELQVRFLHPVRPGEEITALGELVTNRRGKLFEAKAELRNQQGTLLASAMGKYLPVKEIDVAEMAGDFSGDPKWVFQIANEDQSSAGA